MQENDATPLFYLHAPNYVYWLKRPSNPTEQFTWIHDDEIGPNNLPSKFSEREYDYIRRNISKDVRASKTDEIDFSDTIADNKARSPKPPQEPQTEPESETRSSRRKKKMPKQSPDKEQPSDWLEHVPSLFLWLLLGLLLLGIGAAIAVNTQPFIEMTRLIVGDLGIDASRIPVIGWIMGALGIGLVWLVGIVWWAIAQALELAPTLMTASDKRTLRMINAVLGHSGLEIKAGDSQELRWLKSKYNNRPIASLAFFRACRLCVYTMELFICWITHPPIQGSVSDFLTALVTGQFSKINWGNVALTLSVLFLVEVLVRIVLHTLHHIHADRQLAQAEKEAQAK